ncbi:hypothetical protein ES703_121491 [subsurface metagenome]
MVALILGIIAALMGIFFFTGTLFGIAWGAPFLTVLKGFIPPALILGGIIAIGVGISGVKGKMAEKKVAKEKKEK